MGYHRAGFEVVGVDIEPQPNYPFKFHQADALSFPFDGFDVVHASPPCQKWSLASVVHKKNGKEYPDCLTPIRERLRNDASIWVIENVPGAPLENGITLCGLMFGLKVLRHRLFQTSFPIVAPEHPTHKGCRIGEGFFSVAGGAGRWKTWGTVKRNVSKGTVKEWREAMGIDWMLRKELTQAIPPAYTEFIGRTIMAQIKGREKEYGKESGYGKEASRRG